MRLRDKEYIKKVCVPLYFHHTIDFCTLFQNAGLHYTKGMVSSVAANFHQGSHMVIAYGTFTQKTKAFLYILGISTFQKVMDAGMMKFLS